MRHFVIEGPDGAGKTELSRLLCRAFQMAYHHEGPPPATGVFDHYAALLATEQPTIFDRLHLGELVYGPLLRGGSRVSVPKAVALNKLARVIVCLPPLDVTLANSVGRHEFIPDIEIRKHAYRIWELIVRVPEIRDGIEVYDYTRGPYVPR